ncbi:MAG: TIGR03621 family F420-dependent LLM class oxidoreductase [Ilumatobacteraceae bacterium]
MRVGLQLNSDDPTTVADAARRAEELGYDSVLVYDHVGSDSSPLLCLTAAALATSAIRLGTFVLNASFLHPVLLARDVATLDRLSGGRVEVGLGAGHTPAEFAALGVTLGPAAERKARLADFVGIVRRLIDGETVEHSSRWFELAGASTGRALQDRLPILVGGSGRSLLEPAARQADIVGLTGLGRTLPDGHRHVARFAASVVDDEVAIVRAAAGAVGREVELNVLVQRVEITDDREAAAAKLAERIEGLTVADALATPFLALGTHDEIAHHLRRAQDRWGIGYFVVREAEDFAPVIDRLR